MRRSGWEVRRDEQARRQSNVLVAVFWAVLLGLAALGVLVLGPLRAHAAECHLRTVTGYSVEQYPGVTRDGTSTTGALREGRWLAAGPAHQLGQRITLLLEDGEATYLLADTGELAAAGVDYDLLFATTADALQWGRRQVPVCVVAS